jgi:hypothetical protein
MDFVMAMHVLLLTNTKGIFLTEGFHLRVHAFSRIHQTTHETGCLPSVAVQSESGTIV